MSIKNIESKSKVTVALCVAAIVSAPSALAEDAAPTPPPFKTAGVVSRTLQTVTGLNLLGSVIAGQAAKSVLKKKMGGDVKVKVKLYSFTDMLQGKLKSVDAELDGSKVKGVSVGKVTAKTNQPVWLDLSDKRHIDLKTPVMVSVKTSLSADDIAAALKSDRVKKSLSGLKLDVPGLGDSQLEIINPKVDLTDENVCIQGLLKAEGAPDSQGLQMKITGRLHLKGDDRVEIADMKVESSEEITEPEKFSEFAEELLNPLIDLRRMDRKDHAFRMSSLDVDHKGLNGEGRLLIVPKRPHPAPGQVSPQTPAAQTPATTGIAGGAQAK